MRYIQFLILFGVLTIQAQPVKTSADTHFQNKQWDTAAKLYQNHLKEQPVDSVSWFRLGVSLVNADKTKAGNEALDRALKTGFLSGAVYYQKSRAAAKEGFPELSLSYLQSAANNGFSNFLVMETDPLWTDRLADSVFQKVYEKIKVNAFPCLSDSDRQHFSFWLGDWDVLVNGNKVGENKITLAEGGCAIHEDYTTASTFSGQSMNYFDPKDHKWHQVWVSSTGNVLNYIEVSRSEGMLQFQCDYLTAQGNIAKSRLTFTKNEDGTVRQFFENSSDGIVWSPAFDGLYVRKSNP